MWGVWACVGRPAVLRRAALAARALRGDATARLLECARAPAHARLSRPCAVRCAGLDTCLSIMKVLHEGLGDSKYRPCPLLQSYVDAGWLGQKAGECDSLRAAPRVSRVALPVDVTCALSQACHALRATLHRQGRVPVRPGAPEGRQGVGCMGALGVWRPRGGAPPGRPTWRPVYNASERSCCSHASCTITCVSLLWFVAVWTCHGLTARLPANMVKQDHAFSEGATTQCGLVCQRPGPEVWCVCTVRPSQLQSCACSARRLPPCSAPRAVALGRTLA
jgi:hypothetical protein